MAKTPHDRASHPKRVPNGPEPLMWSRNERTQEDIDETNSKNWAKYGPDAVEDNARREAAHAAESEANK